MKEKSRRVLFRMKMSQFLFWADIKLHFVRRDIAEFVHYGITEEKLAQVETQLKELINFPTDDEWIGDIMIANEEKNRLADIVRQTTTSVLTRAANKIGKYTAEFRRFGVSAAGSLKNYKLLIAAENVQRVAVIYKDILESEGVTDIYLDEYLNQIDLYKEALARKEDVMADRVIAAEKRVEMANALYLEVMKYCQTGKRIWESVSYAHWNDYLSYKKEKSKNKKDTKKAEDNPQEEKVITEFVI